jgi:site-specific recombinase XerD
VAPPAHPGGARGPVRALRAAATVNKHLSALRGVLEACFDLELISGGDLRRATKVKRVSASALPAGRALSAEELAALFATCARGSHGDLRDAALLGVLYGCGLRRSEAAALDLDTGQLRVRRGKGRKDRIVWAPAGALAALRQWLDARGGEPGPLYCAVDKAGSISGRRLSDQAILSICRRRAARAGLAAFSPHDLRRTFIGDLLDRGVDIATVQQLAGHADVTTTARYDRRPERVKRAAAQRLRVPYAGGGS